MSLLGYFWLFNTLNILDGLLTILGIEMGIFKEANLIVIFYIEKLGLYWGMFLVKSAAFAVSLLMYHFRSKFGLMLIAVLYAPVVAYQIFLLAR